MKTLARILPIVLAVVAKTTFAQTAPTLDVKTHAGIAIQGGVGEIYAVQAKSQLSDNWTCLAFSRLPSANFLWLDPAPVQGQRVYRAQAVSFQNMAYIPPGTFRMGSLGGESGRYDNEGPRVRATITRGFFMARNLVTQADYLALMGTNPSYFTDLVVTNNPIYSSSQPVESVSWFDAVAYCEALTTQELAAGRIPQGSRFRLPTEAEWEYACRADTSTRFTFGDSSDDLSQFAWFADNNNKSPRAVGLLLANQFGLYDMHGNVWQWCQDWHGPYPGGNAVDPQGPATGTERVNRGGSYISPVRECRSAMRGHRTPDAGGRVNGFRVVLAVNPD